MKLRAFLAFTLVSAIAAIAAETPFYVGCYTKPDGAKGIYRYQLDLDTGKVTGGTLVAEAKNPTFLAVHPSGDYLYAANENQDGTIGAYEILDDGGLKLLNVESAKGSAFSLRTREYIMRVGLVAIALLFGLVMFNDIKGLWQLFS